MAWEFFTEPEFQEQLDWVRQFCTDKIEPIDLVFPGAAKSRDRPTKALVDPLRQQVKDYRLSALFLNRDLGGAPPANLPVKKLTATNRVQQVRAFLMDIDECGGIVDAPGGGSDRFMAYPTSTSSGIAGGADEALRNQLAERALGMPTDVRADHDVPFSALPG
jgi:hypothetical protein